MIPPRNGKTIFNQLTYDKSSKNFVFQIDLET